MSSIFKTHYSRHCCSGISQDRHVSWMWYRFKSAVGTFDKVPDQQVIKNFIVVAFACESDERKLTVQWREYKNGLVKS